MGNWCDHWKQCIWFLPQKGMTVRKHQEVYIGASHTKTSISYRVKTSLEKEDGGHCDPSPGDNQIFLTPEKIAIYGDCNWRLSMFNVIKNAVSYLYLTQLIIYFSWFTCLMKLSSLGSPKKVLENLDILIKVFQWKRFILLLNFINWSIFRNIKVPPICHWFINGSTYMKITVLPMLLEL